MENIQGFIKNHELLKEDSRVDDYFGLENQIDGFSKKITSLPGSCTIGLIGKFGSGKSTLLHQIKNKRKEEEIWVEFDAWKFPDRKDLWESFVLDFARQVDHKTFQKALNDVNGERHRGIKELIKIIFGGLNLVYPGASIGEKFTYFFNSSPARRVFELQDILTTIISKQEKGICIVIEDIDRSGDAGIFFVETLKQFLKNLNTKNKVIGIIPIGDAIFYQEKNLELYLKCLDYIEFFSSPSINMEKFVGDSFSEELLADPIKKGQIVSFLNLLFTEFPDITTLRLIKLILRKADVNYENQIKDGLDPDWRVTIVFEASRYYFWDRESSYFNKIKRSRSAGNSDSLFSSFLFTIILNDKTLLERYENGRGQMTEKFRPCPRDIKLIPRINSTNGTPFSSTPWIGHSFEESDGKAYFNCDFYLNY